jgi:hypothetical protein
MGAIIGAIIGSVFSLPVGGAVIGISVIIFALFFNRTIWPLISRRGLYENFFSINQTRPLVYVAEGIAGGVIVGGLLGIIIPGYLVLVLAVIGALVLVFRYHETVRLMASFLGARVGGGRSHSAGYRQLLRRAGGDQNLVERLIAYEKQRAPAASREECIERAIMRWDRDKR